MVLLLVMQPDLDAREQLRSQAATQLLEQRCIDPAPVVAHFGAARPSEEPARRPIELFAYCIVVAVEENRVRPGREPLDAGRLQHERFEEPSRVRAVPFGRAGVGHALRALVFCRQRLSERFGLSSHAHELARNLLSRHRTIHRHPVERVKSVVVTKKRALGHRPSAPTRGPARSFRAFRGFRSTSERLPRCDEDPLACRPKARIPGLAWRG